MKLQKTGRGFVKGKFKDRFGAACSIQESSIMEDGGALWLGLDEGKHFEGQCFARMHLTREMVVALIPLLQHFVETGLLPEEEEEEEKP